MILTLFLMTKPQEPSDASPQVIAPAGEEREVQKQQVEYKSYTSDTSHEFQFVRAMYPKHI